LLYYFDYEFNYRRGGVVVIKSKIVKIAQISLVTSLVLMPVFVLAIAGPNTGELPSGNAVTLDQVLDWIKKIVTFLMAAGVLLAVLFVVWGGISYMAAGSDTEKATVAKDRIKNGVIGAAVVLGVGVILQTVASLVQGRF
jgi:hypothetical protein